MFKTRFGFTVLLLLLSHFSRVLRSADCQGPLSVGFSRQEYWSGLPCTPPGDLPDPGIEPGSRALQADSSPLSHQGSPVRCCSSLKSQNSLEGDSTVCQGIQKGGASPEHLADL